MPTIRQRLRRALVWADVDQACELKPLHWYQRIFRWIERQMKPAERKWRL